MRSEHVERLSRAIRCGALVLATHAGIAFAQTGDSAALHVRVVDPNNAPIGGADVRLKRRGRDETVGARTTDGSGTVVLRTKAQVDSLELEIRRVGFISTRRLVTIDADRPLAFEIHLARLPIRLDTVHTVERALALDKRPVVDSSEIAASKRPIFYLDDVMRKLRPGMLYQALRCPRSRASPSLRVYVNDTYIPAGDLRALRLDLHAEHIAEVRYVNCFDRALRRDNHPQAGHLYVTLKRGYTFNLGRGTYAVSGDSGRTVATALDAGFRGRIVGVFNEVTGRPIEGVTITDLASRVSAMTTSTGTLSLFFVDTTGSLIRVDKLGYTPLIIAVENAPGAADLTLTLIPRSEVLVTAKAARSSADTSSKLDAVGFYARRDGWPPSTSVFFSNGEIAETGAVSRFLTLTQHASCDREIRIDGTPVATDSTGTYSWIDAQLKPDMVAAAEVYTRDLPAEIDTLEERLASRRSSAADGRCVTLIWTK